MTITLNEIRNYRQGFQALLEEQPWIYLVIDHTTISRKFVVNALEKAQCDRIVEFKDAESALAALKELDGQPVFIVDLNLPGLSGAEMAQKLKAHPLLKRCPILLMTDDTRRHRILTALRSGADCVLAKPFDAAYLLERLAQVKALPIQWAPPES
ncbi:response regulator [Myxococcota bacterium]|nr:response regulator [Myxococcota bacterium]MBU1897862.1 response regulator [Myxococcota bacterium]